MAASPTALRASGSYLLVPPRPPESALADSFKYELGKAIFAGKAELKEQSSTETQAQFTRLERLQEQLPARVKRTVNLTNLAGKLSREQLNALEYFLKIRHKVG
jgi:hypothetical protein